MADEEKKRIVQYQEASDFRNDDYALIDNSITGTRKIKVDGKLVKVTDVQVDNTTVMDGSIAKIDLTGKQDVLTPGNNIQISGNTISATDTKYTAGTNVQINSSNVISATDTTYSAFSGSAAGLVPASTSGTQDKYLRGDGNWATPPGGGGGGGSTVSITPIVTSGTKIASATVDGVTSDLYAPTPPTISVNQIQSTGTKIGQFIINNVANDLYAPNPTQVSVGQIQSTGTKIASISVNGTATDIYAPSGGGGGSTVSVTQLQSTGTRIATVTVDNVSTDLYSPNPGSTVTITNTEPSGSTIATIGIDGVNTDIKVPAGSNSVDQVPDSSNNNYEVLLAGSTGNTPYVGGVNKAEGFDYNPNYKYLTVWNQQTVSNVLEDTRVTISPTQISVESSEGGSLVSQLSIKDWDIQLAGTNVTWDGTNTSLTAAIGTAGTTVRESNVGSVTNEHRVLLSSSASDVAAKGDVYKSSKLRFQPSTGNLILTEGNIILPGDNANAIMPAANQSAYVGKKNNQFFGSYINNMYSQFVRVMNNSSETYYHSLDIEYDDIEFNYNGIGTALTWDGINTSLKTAFSSMFKTKTFTITYTGASGSIDSYIDASDWQIVGYTCLGLIRWSSLNMIVGDVQIDYGVNHKILITVENPTSVTRSGDAKYTFLYVHTGCVTEL